MNYNNLFVWIALMSIFAKSENVSYLTIENGYYQIQVKRIFSFIIFLPIIIFVCISTSKYWGDYSLYLDIYRFFPTDASEAIAYIRSQNDCYLFYALTYIVKILSGGNVLLYRIVLAMIQSLPFIYLFQKYSTDYVFSVFLFVATGNPLGWMLNGVRQFIAAAIIYSVTPDIVEKRYVKVALTVLFAYFFHQTAFIMLPIIFICQGKAWNWKTNLAIIGIVILSFVFTRNTGSFAMIAETAGYDMTYYSADDGTHPLRVLVYFIPVVIAFLHRKELEEDDKPIINILINMSIISFGIYLISMVTSGILVGRVPLYTSLYDFVFLPYLFQRLYNGSMKTMMYTASIVGYLLFYYFLYMR